jgi:hypothetical protein
VIVLRWEPDSSGGYRLLGWLLFMELVRPGGLIRAAFPTLELFQSPADGISFL